jgi:hypothetical protein
MRKNMDPRTSRRRFLGSAAAVIGLPYLASVVARDVAAAESCANIQRFIAFFVPNGIHMPDFTPSVAGKDWAMPYILSSLEPIRNKIAVVTGIDYHKTAQPAEPPGGHGSGTGAFLTMMPVNGNDKNPARISLDQRIAQATAACGRPLPSFQLGMKVKGDGSDKTPNIAFIETISWEANKPKPFVDDPQANFDRIFAGVDPSASASDAERRKVVRTSVLDHVLSEADSLKTQLSASDLLKLDEYMTSVRELETRIQNVGGGGAGCMKPTKPSATGASPYEQRVPLALELAALAFECDATRVISFMFGRGNSMQDFAFLFNGESTPHHLTSHHAGNVAMQTKLKEISRWEVDQVATFLKRLDRTDEGGGRTALDNTLAYFNSEISDGNPHLKYDMPVLLAGSAGGKLKVDGSHYMYTQMKSPRPLVGPRGGPHGIKLFVSIMNAFGIPDNTFGDGSAEGPLTELMV